jgi:predicted CXXCH cytochrome family protein
MNAPRMRLLLWGPLVCLLGIASTASALDPPHDESAGIVACNPCHSAHGSSYPSLLATLCESCHYEGGPALAVQTHSSRSTDAGYGNWDVKCWGCHDPHEQHQNDVWGTSYGMFLAVNLEADIDIIDPNAPGPYYYPLFVDRTVTSSNVEHTSPNTFVDGDVESSDDICQVCHLSTSNFNTGGAFNFHSDYGADSQPGGDCVSCHPHGGGFAPTAGGGCTGCHSNAQGPGNYRRQVTGAGGDFERASHHVTDGSTTEIVIDEDCQVCHDQADHQANADPSVLLNDPDGGTGFSYDGTGGSIGGLCLGCHDADSSLAFDADGNPGDGNQPFSDGRTPTDIATAFVTSSHGTSPVAALADESCLACHGGFDGTRSGLPTDQGAHGSALSFLLSPTVAGTTVLKGEEDLCFACHDGLTASTDIEGEFGGTATFTDGSGAMINSHHDVSDADQAYSGAVIECGNCHDPHAASATNKLLPDPDPDDGVFPTAGFSWTGSSLQSEWCLDCHDGSFPATVTPPTNALVNLAAVYPDPRGDQHGADDASNKVVLRPGSGYQRGDILECTVCHNPGHGDDASGTVYPNLFNLRSVIYAADGVTPLIPDSSWDPVNPEVVRLTDLSNSNVDPNTNGKAWCSACHPDPMGGSKNSGCLDGNCHHHGTNSY